MLNFTYEQLPIRVVFGAGSFDPWNAGAALCEADRRLGVQCVVEIPDGDPNTAEWRYQ